MTNNTRITLASVTARLDEQDARFDRMEGLLVRLAMSLEAPAPAAEVTAHVTVPGIVVEATPAVEAKPAKAALLSKEEFKALKVAKVVPWGMTQKQAREAGLIGGGAAVPQVVAQVAPQAPARKAERAPEPEFGTEAWIAWAQPAEGPRRADGTCTPKAEWAKRFALAETGAFDRHEIDRAMQA